MTLLGIIHSCLNFCEYYPLIKVFPNQFWPAAWVHASCHSPLLEATQPSVHCWHLPAHCPPWEILVLPFLALLGSGRREEVRAGLLFPVVMHPQNRKQRNPIQPGSRQHWLVSSNTRLLPSQEIRTALCLQSRCVCMCLHAWVHGNKLSKSTLSSLSVLWRCASPQILEKPCGAIYFIFEHC